VSKLNSIQASSKSHVDDDHEKILTPVKGPLKVRKHAPINAHKKFVMQTFFPTFSYMPLINLCMRRQMAERLNVMDEMEMA
jgi:hypothetical protein